MITIKPHLTREELEARVKSEPNANLRDRLRLILWAMDGKTMPQCCQGLGVKPDTAWTWVMKYNKGGPEALRHQPGQGRKRKLTPEQEEQVRAFVDSRAHDQTHSCRLTGGELRDHIEEHMGVSLHLSKAYALLHRLGYELIRPRPRHEHNDPAKMEEWKDTTAPLLSSKPEKNTPRKTSKSGSRMKRASGKKAP